MRIIFWESYARILTYETLSDLLQVSVAEWLARLRCERTQVRTTPLTVVFIATAAAIYSLEHGLCTFTTVLRSTQPSTLRGTVK